jgi:serine phosphatase RsbU (regulator of sigma subunit)
VSQFSSGIYRIGTDLFSHIGKAPQEDDITMLTLQRKIQPG